MQPSDKNEQINQWAGDFGREYTDRNLETLKQMNEWWMRVYGKSKTQLDEEFFGHLSRDIKILEVGCNVGNQLLSLQKLGFKNLHGVDVQAYALEVAKKRSQGIQFTQSSGLKLPFQDQSFDLVYTCGVLIHIAPSDVAKIMAEMFRCTRKYLFGVEYFAETLQEIPYRGNQSLMWKGDYAKLFAEQFPVLKKVREEKLVYRELYPGNVDCAYLLEKPSPRP